MIKLINNDCFIALKEIADNSINAIITDPPYGILKGHKIETAIDIDSFLKECERVLKPNSFIAFFGQQPTLTKWNASAFKYFKYKTEIIWYKRSPSYFLSDITRVYENITICSKGSRKINQCKRNYCDVKQSLAEFAGFDAFKRVISEFATLIKSKDNYDNAVEFLGKVDKSAFYVKKRVSNESVCVDKRLLTTNRRNSNLKSAIEGLKPQNLVSFLSHNKQQIDMSGEGKGDHNIKHPTVKPIQLMEYLISLLTDDGDLILDPFLGSGTTGIAAKNMKRDFIGIELDTEYFAIAQERINHDR